MKKNKALTLCSVVLTAILSFVGCGDNAPTINGFALPHYNGMSDDGLYDANHFYMNELRLTSADPGSIYVSPEDAEDSFNKSKATAKAQAGKSFDEATWEKENGDLDYWLETYGNKFYCVTTGIGSVSPATKAKYETDRCAFLLAESQDLCDWAPVGRLDGYAVNVKQNGWAYDYFWAPEIIRDSVSGRYFIFASAQARTNGNAATEYFPHYGSYYNSMYGLIAMSDNPIGPYELVSSEEYYKTIAQYDEDGNVKVNANNEVIGLDGSVITIVNEEGKILNKNGHVVTTSTPPENFGRYVPSIRNDSTYDCITNGVKHDTSIWPAIDFNPVIMDNGDFYVFFSQHTSDVLPQGNHVWGMKMKDMITPDFSTLTKIAAPGYVTVTQPDKSAEKAGDIHNFKLGEHTTWNEGSVNEGVFVIQHKDKYYMTYSPIGYGSPVYSVTQAVADNPLGPYKKLGPEYNPVMGINATNDYMAGTGHHSFVKAGNELFAIYHTFYNAVDNYAPNWLGRAIAADRVQFMYNEELGYDILYGNGPTYSLQPLPEVATGKENVAKKAKITCENGNKDTVKYLNDGHFTTHEFTSAWEYVAPNKNKGGTTITLKWDKPVKISAFIVYNACDYFSAFSKVDSVQFKLAEKPSWYNLSQYSDTCYIKDLACNPANVEENDFFMRQGGGALASFNEITVTEMTIYINSKYTYTDDNFDEFNEIHVSEIYVMGNEVA